MAQAGRVLLISKGTWASGVTYNPMDFVYFGGNSYIAKNTITSTVDPSNDSTNWQLMASGFDSDLITQTITNEPGHIASDAAVYAECQKLESNFAEIQTGTTASHAFAVGDFLTLDGVLYRVTTAIASGARIVPGTNCVQDSLGNELTSFKNSVSATTIEVPLTSDVQQYLGELHRLYSYKIGGIVVLTGAITFASALPSNTNIFQLPTDCKPVGTIDITAFNNSTHDIYGMYAVNSQRTIRNTGSWPAGTYNFNGVIPVLFA